VYERRYARVVDNVNEKVAAAYSTDEEAAWELTDRGMDPPRR